MLNIAFQYSEVQYKDKVISSVQVTYSGSVQEPYSGSESTVWYKEWKVRKFVWKYLP